MADNTSQRGYPRPHPDNVAYEDAGRIRSAIDMIDADVTEALSRAPAVASETTAGIVRLATEAEATAGTATNVAPSVARTKSIAQAIFAAAVAGAPETLNTIDELAAALQDNPEIVTVLQSAIALKANSADVNAALGNRLRFDAGQSLTEAQLAQLLTNAGLGTAAKKNSGTAAGEVVSLDANAKLPAIDGSQLTGLSAVPVGTTIWVSGTSAPAGFIKENGALLSRTTYAALWVFAQASGALYTEAQWSAGYSGGFSVGDGSTTFRIPDGRGEFVRSLDDSRGVDTSRALGSNQADEIRQHSHYPEVMAAPGTGGGTAPYITGAGTSTSNGLYGGAETRPRNISKLACIKY